MHLFDLFSDAPNPAQSSMKYEGVSKMSENVMLEAVKNCFIRRPKVCIAFGLASNNFINVLSNTALFAGWFANDFILVAFCRDGV